MLDLSEDANRVAPAGHEGVARLRIGKLVADSWGPTAEVVEEVVRVRGQSQLDEPGPDVVDGRFDRDPAPDFQRGCCDVVITGEALLGLGRGRALDVTEHGVHSMMARLQSKGGSAQPWRGLSATWALWAICTHRACGFLVSASRSPACRCAP